MFQVNFFRKKKQTNHCRNGNNILNRIKDYSEDGNNNGTKFIGRVMLKNDFFDDHAVSVVLFLLPVRLSILLS